MWFITLAESVVGIEIYLGVTLEGPILRASPGSVEGGVLILLSAVGKVVRIDEELRILLPGQKLEKHNNRSVKPLLFPIAWLKNLLCYMIPDTLWHIQGRSCRTQGRSCRGQGRSCRGQGRSCRQYWHTYIRHI